MTTALPLHSFTPEALSELSAQDAVKLTRLKNWRDLMAQLAEPYELRNQDTRAALGRAEFDITEVATGYLDTNEHFCPTAACAIGAAACHPWFNAQGLGINHDLDSIGTLLIDGRPSYYFSNRIAEFFGLDPEVYRNIVTPSQYLDVVESAQDVTPLHVLERIDAALADPALSALSAHIHTGAAP